jgi:hypothetical protein
MRTLADKGLTLRSARLLRDFAELPEITDDHSAALLRVFDASPLLRWQLNHATRTGDLTAFELLPEDAHAGGIYDGDTRTISIPLRMLTPDGEPETTFVLAHELQHALGNWEGRQRVERFFRSAEFATYANFDYTPAIRGYLDWRRDEEAIANLAGWNALVDWVDRRIPGATLDDVVLASRSRTGDFADPQGFGFTLKPLLTMRPDLRFELTADNVAAMGTHYFDRPAADVHLGFLGTSDYRNQYGAWAVAQAASCHRHFTRHQRPEPIMIINAGELGLSRQTLEQNGIDLGGRALQPYLDRSAEPPALDYLHHTIETHQYVPAGQPSSALHRTASTVPARRPTVQRRTDRGR